MFGDDLHALETKGQQIVSVLSTVPGVADLGLFRVLGQPNLNVTVNRLEAARYQIHVSDVQDAIQTAVGGGTVCEVLLRERVCSQPPPAYRGMARSCDSFGN